LIRAALRPLFFFVVFEYDLFGAHDLQHVGRAARMAYSLTQTV